jgi:hypothetical protein
VQADIVEIANAALRQRTKNAEKELEKLLEDEKQHPITYNHYYTDNVQRARLESTRTLIQKAMAEAKEHEFYGKLHVSNNQVDANRLLASLQSRITVDMDEQACSEALDGLRAYYKVAFPYQSY